MATRTSNYNVTVGIDRVDLGGCQPQREIIRLCSLPSIRTTPPAVQGMAPLRPPCKRLSAQHRVPSALRLTWSLLKNRSGFSSAVLPAPTIPPMSRGPSVLAGPTGSQACPSCSGCPLHLHLHWPPGQQRNIGREHGDLAHLTGTVPVGSRVNLSAVARSPSASRLQPASSTKLVRVMHSMDTLDYCPIAIQGRNIWICR